VAKDYRQTTLSNLRVEKDWYSTKQISEIYHVSQATVCNWCRKGWLQADREKNPDSSGRGRSWRIFPQQLEDIEARRDELIELSKKYWVRLMVKMR
jgi:transposase